MKSADYICKNSQNERQTNHTDHVTSALTEVTIKWKTKMKAIQIHLLLILPPQTNNVCWQQEINYQYPNIAKNEKSFTSLTCTSVSGSSWCTEMQERTLRERRNNCKPRLRTRRHTPSCHPPVSHQNLTIQNIRSLSY